MKTIEVDGEVYALKVGRTAKEGSEWFGDKHESLQAQRFSSPQGKEFRPHFHIINPRTIKRTQEAFIVISGRLAVTMFNMDGVGIGELEAGPGEAVFVYRGGHGVRVIDDCVAYEVKAGSFTYVSEDKGFIHGDI